MDCLLINHLKILPKRLAATCLTFPGPVTLKDCLQLHPLVGATCLHKGGRGNASGKKKPSTRSYKYRISIDDSTEEVFITVKRQSSSQRVTLKNPRGFNVKSGVIKFPTNVIYKINKPRPGTWIGGGSGIIGSLLFIIPFIFF